MIQFMQLYFLSEPQTEHAKANGFSLRYVHILQLHSPGSDDVFTGDSFRDKNCVINDFFAESSPVLLSLVLNKVD